MPREALVAPVVPIGTPHCRSARRREEAQSVRLCRERILTNKDDPLNGLQSIDPFEQALRGAKNHVDVLLQPSNITRTSWLSAAQDLEKPRSSMR